MGRPVHLISFSDLPNDPVRVVGDELAAAGEVAVSWSRAAAPPRSRSPVNLSGELTEKRREQDTAPALGDAVALARGAILPRNIGKPASRLGQRRIYLGSCPPRLASSLRRSRRAP
jgi:hypothetical protein